MQGEPCEVSRIAKWRSHLLASWSKGCRFAKAVRPIWMVGKQTALSKRNALRRSHPLLNGLLVVSWSVVPVIAVWGRLCILLVCAGRYLRIPQE